MTRREDAFERIAAALERIAPVVAAPHAWTGAPGYVWNGKQALALPKIDALPLSTLRGVDEHKAAVLANLSRLSNQAAAHDMLLWGARGMGKSVLVRSCVAHIESEMPGSLAIVQIGGGTIDSVPNLLAELADQPRAFLIFIDDLGFGADQQRDMLTLRSLLDGGVVRRPANVRIAVTANRRGIVARDATEGAALHERDERDDALALADRFGLTLGFHPCDQETYLEVLRAYTEPLDLKIDEEEALAWAIARGNRSGRTAYQFAVELAGRAGVALDPITR